MAFIILLLLKQSECAIMPKQMLQNVYRSLNNAFTFKKRKASRSDYREELCLEEPIKRCSCIEMLYGLKDLKPGKPIIDEQDIKNKRRASAKKYHPDNGNAKDDQPLNFLNLCAKKLLEPKFRKHYLEHLHFFLKNCEKQNYDEKLCRNFVEDLNNRLIIQENFAPTVPFQERDL